MMSWLTEPFGYEFMVRALLATLAVCVAAPLCGVWALSRRLVYLTDAMSHSILAGVAGAALIGGSLLLGGLLAAVTMALFVSVLVVRARVPEDGAIGVVGQGLFALGVLGVSMQTDPRALTHILFGNALTVTATDAAINVALAILVVVVVTAIRPVLIATTFDAVHARTVGIRVGLVDAVLLIVLSLTVVTGLVTVGVLMAVTLMIAPAVTARLLAGSLDAMVGLAVGCGVVSGVVGVLISYHAGLPTGPTVALVAVAQVGMAAVWSRPGRALRRIVRDRQPLQSARIRRRSAEVAAPR